MRKYAICSMLFAINLDMTYDRGEASHKVPCSTEASADKYVTSTGSVGHISIVWYLLPCHVIFVLTLITQFVDFYIL